MTVKHTVEVHKGIELFNIPRQLTLLVYVKHVKQFQAPFSPSGQIKCDSHV